MATGTVGRIAFWCDPKFKLRLGRHARRLARVENRDPKKATLTDYIIKRMTETMDREDAERRAEREGAE